MQRQSVACLIVGTLGLGCSGKAAFQGVSESGQAANPSAKGEELGGVDPQTSQGDTPKPTQTPMPEEAESETGGVGISLRLPPELASAPRRVGDAADLSQAFALSLADERIQITCDGESTATFDSVEGKDMKAIIAITLIGSSGSYLPAPAAGIADLASLASQVVSAYGEDPIGDALVTDATDSHQAQSLDATEHSLDASSEAMGAADSHQAPSLNAAEHSLDAVSEAGNVAVPCGDLVGVAWPDSYETVATSSSPTTAILAPSVSSELDQTVDPTTTHEPSTDMVISSSDASVVCSVISSDQPEVAEQNADSTGSAGPFWTQTVLYPYTCPAGAVVKLSGLSASESHVVDAVLYSTDGKPLYRGSTVPFSANQEAIEVPMSAVEQLSAMLEVKFVD